MKETLLEKVNAWALEKGVFKSGVVIIAGISGGSDSICLLHVLNMVAEQKGFSVVAVHINHMLRGEEAKQDEMFVREICQEWAIPLKVFHKDVKVYSEEKRLSEEEAGRLVRYQCFHEVRKEMHAQYIAVAHHYEDQAETIFLNLLRGSGLDGLCGMKDVQRHIIRPLLNIRKEEIEAYLQENNLKYRIDSSNLSNQYNRNVIRNVIFPQIKDKTGFSISSSLLRTSGLLKEDRDFLNGIAQEKYRSVILLEEERKVEIDRGKLNELSRPIGGRVIRIAWQTVTGSLKGLEAKHVNAALELAQKEGTNKTIDFPKGVRFQTEYGRMIVAFKEERLKTTIQSEVRVPSEMCIGEAHIHVTAGLFTRREYEEAYGRLEKAGERSLTQLFDYGNISEGIYIRNRLPGDIFSPYNGPGKKKLKDFFIDQKIPIKEREQLLLLAKGKNIIWVIGHRTSENYRITEKTQKILYVKITRTE